MPSRLQQIADEDQAKMNEATKLVTGPIRVIYMVVSFICLLFAAIVDPLLVHNIGKRAFRFHVFILPILAIITAMTGDILSAAFFAVSAGFAVKMFFEASARDAAGLKQFLHYPGDPRVASYLNWHIEVLRIIVNPILVLILAGIGFGGMYLYTQATGETFPTVFPAILAGAAPALFVRELFYSTSAALSARKERKAQEAMQRRQEQGPTEEEQDEMLRAGVAQNGAPASSQGRLK